MKTTSGPKIDITESADKVKKNWVKPEVEVIGRDLIQGGSARFYTEGQRSSVSNHNGYS